MDMSLAGGFVDAPTQSADYFRAALDAMAKPGTIVRLHGVEAPDLPPAAAALMLTFCDPETAVYLGKTVDTADMKRWIAFHTGAPLVAKPAADFAIGTWRELAPLGAYRIGTAEYPDRSATLIVLCDGVNLTPNARISGPGLKAPKEVWLPDPAACRANAQNFPLGLDFIFVAGEQTMALPRSTKIEVL